MKFSRKGDIYIVSRITGLEDNILGVIFTSDSDIISSNSIEVIEWEFPNISSREPIKASKQEIMKQVLDGLYSVNISLGTNYQLSKIFFSPFDSSANQVYSGLIGKLIRHYHSGSNFK